MADYLASVEELPGVAADRARFDRGRCSRPRRPSGPEPLAAILADYRALVEPERHPLAAPGLPRLLRDDRVGPGHPRRDAHGRRSARTRCCGARRRSGPSSRTVVVDWLRQALGLPGDVRRAAHRHRVDLVAHRPRRGPRGGRARRRGARPAPARPGPARPRVYASAEAHRSIEKACMTLGLGRAALCRIPVDDDYEMDSDALAAAIARGPRRRPPPDRDRGHRRHDVVHVGRSGRARSPTSRRARGCGCTSTRPTPGRWR